MALAIFFQQLVQIMRRTGRIAYQELHGLPSAHSVRNRDRAVLRVHTVKIAHQKIAGPKRVFQLSECQPDVRAVLKQLLIDVGRPYVW